MEKALALSYRYLSFRPRTVAEVEMYLEKKAEKYVLSVGEIQSALELLKDRGYLNDVEFIKSFVNSRNLLRPKSKRMLEMELKKLGVTQSDIDTFFSESPTDESGLAQKALHKKMKSLTLISDEKKRFVKAVSFLQRRGFSYDIAKKAYKSLTIV